MSAISEEMAQSRIALAQDLGKKFRGMVTNVYTEERIKEINGNEVAYKALMIEGVVEDGKCAGRNFKFSYRPTHYFDLLEPALKELGMIDPEQLIGGTYNWVLKEHKLPAGYTTNPRFVPTNGIKQSGRRRK